MSLLPLYTIAAISQPNIPSLPYSLLYLPYAIFLLGRVASGIVLKDFPSEEVLAPDASGVPPGTIQKQVQNGKEYDIVCPVELNGANLDLTQMRTLTKSLKSSDTPTTSTTTNSSPSSTSSTSGRRILRRKTLRSASRTASPRPEGRQSVEDVRDVHQRERLGLGEMKVVNSEFKTMEALLNLVKHVTQLEYLPVPTAEVNTWTRMMSFKPAKQLYPFLHLLRIILVTLLEINQCTNNPENISHLHEISEM
ncbi:hypothetical protein BLNAU_18413 [Blattamonas nauphoetae]|uniref:Uncharacterized protein n=1 Tax=Blattamonas nauphoetae TaxID=2049346 RepID=A0ABQ9X8T8_9EUKA|nr:hypothetical protein BLNAU_18413 [Blattamonas nauphoetae]